MAKEIKPEVNKEKTFDRLEIRLGRVKEAELETTTHNPTYKMTVDFGKYGTRVSYGRFTQHSIEEVKNRLVLGVLNFGSRQMGDLVSEVLILGVQYPKAESGEATFIIPLANAKVGGKLF